MMIQLTLPYGMVQEVSFSIQPGECLLLAGPNGCGKTTLLKQLASEGISSQTVASRLLPTASASRSRGPLPLMLPRVAQVCEETPSAASCILIPTGIPKVKGFTAEEFIRTGCYRESDWAGRLNSQAQKRLEEALELLGLQIKRGQDISTLSDGEFQKACIAVGLTRHADVLLLDEPTAFLDVDNRVMVLRTLHDVAERTGTAVIFSSHDLHDALAVADRVLAFTPAGFLESSAQNREAVISKAFPLWK